MRLNTMRAILPMLLLLAACGSPSGEPASTVSVATSAPATTTPPNPTAEAELVMIISENGGCIMMGPNCRTFGLWSDGTAGVYRNGPELGIETLDRAEAVQISTIGVERAVQLITVANATDFDALEARLGPGSCQACVDGVDYLLTLHTDAGPRHLSSSEFDFNQSEPLFQAVDEVLQAMQQRLQLPVETRP